MSELPSDVTSLLAIGAPDARPGPAKPRVGRDDARFDAELSNAAGVPRSERPAATRRGEPSAPRRDADSGAGPPSQTPEGGEQAGAAEAAGATSRESTTDSHAPAADGSTDQAAAGEQANEALAEETTAGASQLVPAVTPPTPSAERASDLSPEPPNQPADGETAAGDPIALPGGAAAAAITPAAEIDAPQGGAAVDKSAGASNRAAEQAAAADQATKASRNTKPDAAPDGAQPAAVEATPAGDASAPPQDGAGPRAAIGATAPEQREPPTATGEAAPEANEQGTQTPASTGAGDGRDRSGGETGAGHAQSGSVGVEVGASADSEPQQTTVHEPAAERSAATPTETADSAETKPATPGATERADPAGPLARIATGRLTGAGANQTDGAGQTPRVDASRFVGRVGKAIQAAQQRGGEVKLRLSPPELGALQIKLLMGEGTLTATLEAETSAARNLLLENLPALRERLAEQDIRIEKFDVDVRDERRQGGGDQADQRRPGGGRPDGGRSGDQRSGERTAGSNQREAKAAQQPPAGTPHASGAQGPASEAINLVA